ncbi:hypothetical protein PC116_g20666 [Phytophthora cactorum]|nr:hypothetical protein Pcac1_g10953 [Phytophthora cactorum]KAG2888789.1 hypothetical protein PC114_g18267 [Phytophthora cactorum]KAG4231043.1 hypothetical protein PC116_g20666 [Phytophthora cactorum]
MQPGPVLIWGSVVHTQRENRHKVFASASGSSLYAEKKSTKDGETHNSSNSPHCAVTPAQKESKSHLRVRFEVNAQRQRRERVRRMLAA